MKQYSKLLIATMIYQLASLLTCASNLDGKPDIFWRHPTGPNGVWFLSGTSSSSLLTTAYLDSKAGAQWNIATVGDFDGDRLHDFLWQNSSTGETEFWLNDNAITRNRIPFMTVPQLNWKIVGAGYLNGDSSLDIVWRDTISGGNVVWFMNGTTVIGSTYIQWADPSWQFGATADFNQDGHQDFLWRNNISGNNVVWLMNGTAVSSTTTIPWADPGWSIVGAAYFNSDTSPDILWRHNVSGSAVAWYMNGTSFSSYAYIPSTSDTQWQMVGVGDAASDTDGDLLGVGTEFSAGTNPANPYSKAPGVPDSRYLSAAPAGGDGQSAIVIIGISYTAQTLTITVTGLTPYVPYDVAWTSDLNSKWKLSYYGVSDDYDEQFGDDLETRQYTIPLPATGSVFYMIGDASDEDQDGLPAWYESVNTKTMFDDEDGPSTLPGAGNIAENGVADGFEDTDADGIPSSAEYALGSDPTVATSSSGYYSFQISPNSTIGDNLAFIPLRAGFPPPAVTAVSLTVDGVLIDASALEVSDVNFGTTANPIWVTMWGVLVPAQDFVNGTKTIGGVVHLRKTFDPSAVNYADTIIDSPITPITVNVFNSISFLGNKKLITGNSHIFTFGITSPSAQSGSYTITVSMLDSTIVKSLTGNYAGGVISRTWNLQDQSGQTIPNDSAHASLDVAVQIVPSLGGGLAGAPTAPIYMNPPLAFDFPENGYWLSAGLDVFRNVGNTPLKNEFNEMMFTFQSVGNNTIAGGTGEGSSQFVIPFGNDIAASKQAARNIRMQAWQNLRNTFSRPEQRNFVYFGHGGPTTVGGGFHKYTFFENNPNNFSGVGGSDLEGLSIFDVAGRIKKFGNYPYRFVFLHGCSTMEKSFWNLAFNIPDTKVPDLATWNSVFPGRRPGLTVGYKGPVFSGGSWGNHSQFMNFAKFSMANWGVQTGNGSFQAAMDLARQGTTWWPNASIYNNTVEIRGYLPLKVNQYNTRSSW